MDMTLIVPQAGDLPTVFIIEAVEELPTAFNSHPSARIVTPSNGLVVVEALKQAFNLKSVVTMRVRVKAALPLDAGESFSIPISGERSARLPEEPGQ